MGSSKISNSVKSAADIQRLDTSYFIPWRLDMLYEIEPELENVAKRATWRKHRQFANKLEAYSIAKHEADFLVAGLPGIRGLEVKVPGTVWNIISYVSCFAVDLDQPEPFRRIL